MPLRTSTHCLAGETARHLSESDRTPRYPTEKLPPVLASLVGQGQLALSTIGKQRSHCAQPRQGRRGHFGRPARKVRSKGRRNTTKGRDRMADWKNIRAHKISTERPDDWPQGVRAITQQGLVLFGINEATGQLYWDGSQVRTRNLLRLGTP